MEVENEHIIQPRANQLDKFLVSRMWQVLIPPGLVAEADYKAVREAFRFALYADVRAPLEFDNGIDF